MFDREKVLERTGGPELLARLVSRLSVLLPQHLESIDAAIQAGQAKDLERSAHSLKGALANFEAPESVALARQMEEYGAAADLAAASAALPELRRVALALLPELREFAGLPPAES